MKLIQIFNLISVEMLSGKIFSKKKEKSLPKFIKPFYLNDPRNDRIKELIENEF